MAVLLLAVAYWVLFVPTNLVGADDHDMLGVASGNGDNIHMYDCVMRMTIGRSFRDTLHNLLYYDWYYYGYLFFLLSRLSTLPAGALVSVGAIDPIHAVSAHMLALKQLASACVVLAASALVYAWTGFKTLVRTVFLLLFLFSIPVVFGFNLFWHPESLAALFAVAALYGLERDGLRFGGWFDLAALACGLALGVKGIGIFFLPSLAAYLALGWLARQDAQARTAGSLEAPRGRGWYPRSAQGGATDAILFVARHGARFGALMIAGLVVTNPLIVVPEGLEQYAAYARASLEWGREGFLLGQLMQPGAGKSWFDVLSTSCGHWWMYVLIGGIWVFGIASHRQSRLLTILTMTWVLPFATYLVCLGVPDRPHYFLSVALPLMASVGSPAMWEWREHVQARRRTLALLLLTSTVALCAAEAIHHVRVDAAIYRNGLDRVRKSRAVASGRDFDRAVLSDRPHDRSVRILRDDPIGLGSLYIPGIERFDVPDRVGLLRYEDIEQLEPAIIVLLKANVDFYSSDTFVRHYAGYPEDTLIRSFQHPFVRASWRFYRDAEEGRLRGFHPVWSDDFAVAFERN